MTDIHVLVRRASASLSLPERSVGAVVQMLEDGNTVPFIARYRKEATGSLDEVQIRDVRDRYGALKALEERRATIRASLSELGALNDGVARRLDAAETLSALEDVYRPFKPKRRTRATIARDRGLEPLARSIRNQPRSGDPHQDARAFVSAEREVPDVEAALAGARDIVAEATADRSDVRAWVRNAMLSRGEITSKVKRGHAGEKTKFEPYYDHSERARHVPSHRYLAMRRGEKEGILRVSIRLDPQRDLAPLLERTVDRLRIDRGSRYAPQLQLAAEDALQRLIVPSVQTEVLGELKKTADEGAVRVFGKNLESLLLSAPFGARPVIGIDPGLRTGAKVAVLTDTGAYVDNTTLRVVGSSSDIEQSAERLASLIRRHRPSALAIGNGTGDRETQAVAHRAVELSGANDTSVVSVNEAGASVYSASDLAREELPELDLTIRGAVSIGRRLQDPLAELVKIDPKSIGVGQYQHDVPPALLEQGLSDVVESCVNRVGVELNTASYALLGRVAGVGPKLAQRIVAHREASGPFRTRADLLGVKGLGKKTFEQAAGFLRIRDGANPLDRSAVHPERYKLVERMARDAGMNTSALVGSDSATARLDWRRYVSDDVGEPTLRDILAELAKPGRDPRASFEAPSFRADLREVSDLRSGMELEGTVTNVTNFGAFVDVGVHQDGLVHISKLANHFVRDPHEVVHSGQRVRVRVLEVDVDRRRISLERIQ